MGLHCEYHPASNLFGYFKQDQSNRMDSIPGGDDATGASGTGPVTGYSLKLISFILFNFVLNLSFISFILFNFVLNLNTCTCFVSLTIVMKILFNYIFNFGIKLCPKVPIFLTIQKPDYVNRLSVASFASSIKPPPFTGSNYKRWRERAILWFTVMRVMYVTEGKPSQYTPEEESAFETADNLFRGCLISVLAENLVDTYIRPTTGKQMWDAL